MNDAIKPERRNNAFSVDRRTLFGAVALAGGFGAAGLPLGAAAGRRIVAEPDLADVTANAPGYSGQPERARAKAAEYADPLDIALRG